MVKDIGSVGKPYFLQQYQKASGAVDDSGFKETMRAVADRLGTIQAEAKDASDAVVMGNSVDSHDVMIAAQEAGLAFELMLEVRNKLIEAYQEIMRMQV